MNGRYWGLSQRERALLTPEEVEAAIRREMMEEGVVAPEPPKTEPLLKIELEHETRFRVSMKADKSYCFEEFDAIFETAEDAQAFIRLRPKRLDYNYSAGSKYTYEKQAAEYSIQPCVVYLEGEINGPLNAILKKNKEAERANAEEAASYEKEMSLVEGISGPILDDYRACLDMSDRLLRIVNVYRQYIEDAEGNSDVAMNFLRRAFTAEQIDNAREWHGVIPPSY